MGEYEEIEKRMTDAISYIDDECDSLEEAESLLTICVATLAGERDDENLTKLFEDASSFLEKSNGMTGLFSLPISGRRPMKGVTVDRFNAMAGEYLMPIVNSGGADLALFGFAYAMAWIHIYTPFGDTEEDKMQTMVDNVREAITEQEVHTEVDRILEMIHESGVCIDTALTSLILAMGSVFLNFKEPGPLIDQMVDMFYNVRKEEIPRYDYPLEDPDKDEGPRLYKQLIDACNGFMDDAPAVMILCYTHVILESGRDPGRYRTILTSGIATFLKRHSTEKI